MEYYNRPSVSLINKQNQNIEVTEWSNREGVDVSIDDNYIAVSYADISILRHLIYHLENRE